MEHIPMTDEVYDAMRSLLESCWASGVPNSATEALLHNHCVALVEYHVCSQEAVTAALVRLAARAHD